MKLRTRINLYTMVAFLLLIVVMNGTIYFTFSQMMVKNELERAVDDADKTVRGMTDIETSAFLRAFMPINGMLRIVKENGEVDTASTSPKQQELRKLSGKYFPTDVQQIVKGNNERYTFVSYPVVLQNGEIANLQILESLSKTEQTIKTLRLILIIITLISILPVFYSTSVLSNFIIKPLANLIRTMKEIRESGKYKQIELPKQSKDELYEAGLSFNEMIQQLQENYERQEQFVSNASHELRTPLTVIESYASLVKRRGKDQPELLDEAIEAIHSEALRMKDLTEQLLLLAKNDKKWKIEQTNVNVTKIIQQSAQSFQAAFKREVICELENDVFMETDEQKFKQLLYIFIENAYKYSEDEITIRLTAKENIEIEINDRGIGIPKEDIPHIFDRFYRVDKARARKTGGFGLGLALAQEIAKALHAILSIESVVGIGTQVKITFKVNVQKAIK